MPLLDPEHIGARIAAQRKIAGLTQQGLALRIPYSYSLLHQVEAGHKNASPDLVSAVARALRIDVTVLTGQPYMAELQQDRLADLIRPIREALDLYDLGADPSIRHRSLPELQATAEQLCRQVRATQLHKAAAALPEAMAELTTAAWSTPSTEVWRALASLYRTAHDITVKLGFFDLSSIALARMDWAAERASDPLLAAIRQYMRALVYFREGEHSIGLRLINAGQRLLTQAEESTASLAVAGQLHLGASVISARAQDSSAVTTHLSEAWNYAARTGEAGHVHWLSFGPTNVAAHQVSADVEMRRYGEALVSAKAVRIPNSWALSRRAHFCIDLARAAMEAGQYDTALRHLLHARRLAAQQTRYHPGARETIKGLVHQRRKTPDALDSLAAWIGM